MTQSSVNIPSLHRNRAVDIVATATNFTKVLTARKRTNNLVPPPGGVTPSAALATATRAKGKIPSATKARDDAAARRITTNRKEPTSAILAIAITRALWVSTAIPRRANAGNIRLKINLIVKDTIYCFF